MSSWSSMFVILMFVILIALSIGCTSLPLASEIGMPQSISFLAEVGTGNLECEKYFVFLRESIKKRFAKVKMPDHLKIFQLHGSTLCGLKSADGGKGKIKVKIGWNKIKEGDFSRAKAISESLNL